MHVRRQRGSKPGTMLGVLCIAIALLWSCAAKAETRVYLLRGWFGVFSTGDFEDALIALLGRDAGGLSASTIGRLKEARSEEHARWSKRDLSAAISTSGSTAFTCRPVSKTPRNAC